jgi:CheY-like chemotaxis protein
MASILIVEDEAILAMNTRLSLEQAGHQVMGVAVSGRQALEMMEKDIPDLVLMDVVLQGDLNGIELTRIINERFGTHIVYVTAHTDEDTIRRANETGHRGFLRKPFEEYQLLESIRDALG